MTFIIDIDDTILVSEKYNCQTCKRLAYKAAKVILDEIKALNELYDKGHTIMLHTGRNWDCYEMTVNQLKKFNVKYHNLVMGKPQGIYIDRTQNLSSVLQAVKLAEGKKDV